MTTQTLADDLRRVIDSRRSLASIAEHLAGLRDLGLTRDEVREALDFLRSRAPDEATEDRILEALDLVAGFCPPHLDVWGDPA